MPPRKDIQFLERREAEERAAARATSDTSAREAHLALARCYAEQAAAGTTQNKSEEPRRLLF